MPIQTLTPQAPLYESVRSIFILFNMPHEGLTDHIYPDKDNGLTTAIGYLIDSVAAAQKLPWHVGSFDGPLATPEQVAAEWTRIKALDLRKVPAKQMRSQTTLRLDTATIERITLERLDAMARDVANRLPEFLTFPADAQLGVLSMCWALGVDRLFRLFPKFLAALRAGDFKGAAAECKIDDSDNAGVTNRNIENARLFVAAAKVKEKGLDPSELTPQRPLRPSVNTVRGQQTALKLLGYDVGPVDGVKGPLMEAAVKRFQADHSLTPDGIVGPKTMRKLGEVLAEHARQE